MIDIGAGERQVRDSMRYGEFMSSASPELGKPAGQNAPLYLSLWSSSCGCNARAFSAVQPFNLHIRVVNFIGKMGSCPFGHPASDTAVIQDDDRLSLASQTIGDGESRYTRADAAYIGTC